MLRNIPQYLSASRYVRLLLYISLLTPLAFILVQTALIGFSSVTLSSGIRATLVTAVLSICTYLVLRRVRKIETTLQDLAEARDHFLSMASHDLKTPLSAIAMSVDLLLHESGRKNDSKSLQIIQRQTGRMIQMLDDLLLSQAATHGKLELRIEPCPIKHVVEDALGLLAPQFQSQRINLSVDVEDLVCPCDQDRLQQILINLLSNSIKHTPVGGRISIKGHTEDSMYCFTVEDNGQGIAKEKLEHIFEPYNQVTSQKGSYGLGLTIVRTLVEAHGGKVWVESWLGRGSKFFFTIKKGGCEPPRRFITKETPVRNGRVH